MSEQLQAAPHEQGAVTPSPGSRLRAAREALGMSVQDVAAQLKLDVSRIEDLENDKASMIAAPVFLSGYLRAYARLVNLSADELTADHAQLARLSAPELKPIATPVPGRLAKVPDNLPAHMTLKDRRVRGIGISAVVALALIVAAGAWWLNSADVLPEEAEPADQVVAAPIPAPQPLSPNPEAAVTQPESTVAPASTPPSSIPAAPTDNKLNPTPAGGVSAPRGAAAGASSPAPAVASAPTSSATPPAASVTTPLATNNNRPRLTQAQLAQFTGTDSAPPAPFVSGVVPGGEHQLSFAFSADSWIEVADAAGERLIYRLARAGDMDMVSGTAPFTIQLGNLPGVMMQLDGNPYSLARFSGRTAARFTLGTSRQPNAD